MQRYRTLATLGTALGIAASAALAVSPAAGADPIDDAWPYGPPTWPTWSALQGFGGPVTNFEQHDYGFIDLIQYDATRLSSYQGDDWYSEHFSSFNIPFLAANAHEVVTALLDDSATYPNVGTVADTFAAFTIPFPVLGPVSLIQFSQLSDPELGSASTFSLLGSVFVNTYLSDTAGIKDIVTLLGQTFTLFEVPFAASATAGVADLGDGFQQLLTEFTGAFPGLEPLLSLF